MHIVRTQTFRRQAACTAALTSLALLTALPQTACAQIIAGTYTSANGNPFGHGPASSYPTEYQELYNPADFTGPFTISSIGFASWPGNQVSGSASFDVTLSLSTTKTAFNNPSTTFATNEGQTVQTVFSGTQTATLQENGTFDLIFPTQAYTYDPSQGTLLLDIVVHSTPVLPAAPTYFETDSSGTAFTRVWTSSGTNVKDDFGMVTKFSGTPAPEASTTVSLGLLLCLGLCGLTVQTRRRKAQTDR